MFALDVVDGLSAFESARVGQVAAVAEGQGCDWARVDPQAPGGELALRLVPDVPVSGHVLDPDGRPVAGAKVRVMAVSAYAGEDLKGLLEEVRAKNAILPGAKRWFGPLPGQPPTLTTGADGRFRVSGFGRERVVGFDVVEGPGIAHTNFWVMTRAEEAVVGPGKEPTTTPYRPFREAPVKLYGSTFRYLAMASRPIRGVVSDKETNKPMAGVLMWADIPVGAVVAAPGTRMPSVVARTDKEGRYELLGLPKSESYNVYARPDTGRHFGVGVRFKDAPGLGPLAADIQVPGGAALVRGKVTNKSTGKPVAGARVHYFPLWPNPEVGSLTDYTYFESAVTAGVDGSFTVAALSGSGILAAVAPAVETYQPARVTPRELIDFLDKYKEPHPPTFSDSYLLHAAKPGAWGGILPQRSFHALSLIHSEKKDQVMTCDLVLQP
jgi:hypothetical protein